LVACLPCAIEGASSQKLKSRSRGDDVLSLEVKMNDEWYYAPWLVAAILIAITALGYINMFPLD
jgi:hypothetical protein